MEEDNTNKVLEIKATHFEESMKFACRSVSNANISKYQAFAQTLLTLLTLLREYRSVLDITTYCRGSNEIPPPLFFANKTFKCLSPFIKNVFSGILTHYNTY